MNDSGDSKQAFSLSDIPALSGSNVRMKNVDQTLRKIADIVRSKSDKLQVIMDYDLTMTKQHLNGNKTLSSFGLLCLCKNLPPGFLEADQKVKDKYYPIEIDPNMSPHDKSPHMVQWYQESEKHWNGVKLDLDELNQVIEDSGPELRDGTVEMCKVMENSKIPVLVLSAGLGNVLTEVLKHHGLHEGDYFHVISNFFKFENGVIRGYGCQENGLFIHPFNKNGFGCSGYFNKLGCERSNVMIIGDSLGDSNMDQGVPQIETTLKIGFLYGTSEFIEDSLPHYLNSFDVVLIDDQTMNVPRAILDLVIGQ